MLLVELLGLLLLLLWRWCRGGFWRVISNDGGGAALSVADGVVLLSLLRCWWLLQLQWLFASRIEGLELSQFAGDVREGQHDDAIIARCSISLTLLLLLHWAVGAGDIRIRKTVMGIATARSGGCKSCHLVAVRLQYDCRTAVRWCYAALKHELDKLGWAVGGLCGLWVAGTGRRGHTEQQTGGQPHKIWSSAVPEAVLAARPTGCCRPGCWLSALGILMRSTTGPRKTCWEGFLLAIGAQDCSSEQFAAVCADVRENRQASRRPVSFGMRSGGGGKTKF